MAYLDLTTQEMVNISEAWLSPEGRARFEALAAGPTLLDRIERARDRLVSMQRGEHQLDVALQRLRDQLVVADGRHDSKARALHGGLGAMAEGSDDAARGEALRRVQALLFPEGLKGLTRSYRSEAGEAALVRGRMTEEALAALASAAFDGGTLRDVYDAWLAAADALGALLASRDQLEQRAAEDRVTSGEVLEARHAWIKVVRLIERMLEVDEVDAATQDTIFASLREAEAKARRRGGRGGAGQDGATQGDSADQDSGAGQGDDAASS